MNNSNIKEALKKIIKEFDCDYDGKGNNSKKLS